MATRRIVASEKTILQKDDHPSDEKSNISPAVPKHVIFKLLAFTLAMVVLPIGSYFLTVDRIFKGVFLLKSFIPIQPAPLILFSNSSYAGALAALLANVVLISYVVVAMNEDESDNKKETSKAESRKDR